MDDEELPPDIDDRPPEPTAEEREIERIMEDLVERKYARGVCEAEAIMLDRVLDGLSRTCENAAAIRTDIEYYSSMRLRD
jgi:hypothetical protein